MNDFLAHVKAGLSQYPKKLSSRYFYDAKGDALFQQIMQMEEYYLPACEMDIINHQSSRIAQYIAQTHAQLQIVELGAGDGSKTKHFVRQFVPHFQSLHYVALDISPHVLTLNKKTMIEHIPKLEYQSLAGNYFSTYAQLPEARGGRLVLFLGANIGNFLEESAIDFVNFISSELRAGDRLLVAFDLVKHPRKIINAYDDKQGITKAFNLNLLTRINRELGADFKLDQFDHYPFYNPQNGVTASFIISLQKQQVQLADGSTFDFEPFETIHTEVSKKFFPSDIARIAEASELTLDKSYTDTNDEYAFVLLGK